MGHCPTTDYYLQLCAQNSHRRRQDQGRKCETMSLISFSSLINIISSVELPYLSTATNWRLHANDKELSGDESVSVGQTAFFYFWNGFSYLHNLKRLKFNDFIDGTKVLWESGDEVLCYTVHPFTTDIVVTSNMYLGNTITDIKDFIMSGLGIKNMWWLGIWQRKVSLNYHCQVPHQLLMAMQWNEHQLSLDKHNCPGQGVTPAWKKREKCFDLFSNSLI